MCDEVFNTPPRGKCSRTAAGGAEEYNIFENEHLENCQRLSGFTGSLLYSSLSF